METRFEQKKGSDIVLELLHAEEEKDFDKVAKSLTDDFTFSGPVPKPIGSKEYIEVHRALLNAFPDLRFNFTIIKEDANEVTGKAHLTGTHTGDLTVPMIPNVGTVHATGRRISLPEEKVHITVKGNKINRFDVDKVPGGGVMGILSQIGVDVHELA